MKVLGERLGDDNDADVEEEEEKESDDVAKGKIQSTITKYLTIRVLFQVSIVNWFLLFLVFFCFLVPTCGAFVSSQ